jgi:hypothetical protein
VTLLRQSIAFCVAHDAKDDPSLAAYLKGCLDSYRPLPTRAETEARVARIRARWAGKRPECWPGRIDPC